MKKFSWSYAIFKVYMSIPYRIFYKNIKVDGIENIPDDQPVMIAPNHQNALMDPLAVIFSIKRQTVFLSRGDFFTNPKLAKIFTWLKMLPSYRERDGKENLHKNQEFFNISANSINNCIPYCLFPEAQHNEYRSLLPLRKAVPRISFLAMEKSDFKSKINIIPVGINYSDKNHSRSTLYIKYGKAILLNKYTDLYKENPQRAMHILRNDMADSLKPLIINIEDKEYYDFYENLREIYSYRLLQLRLLKFSQGNKLKIDQEVIKKVGDYKLGDDIKFKHLHNTVSGFVKELNSNKLPLNTFSDKKSLPAKFLMLFVLVLLSPFYIVGSILNVLPFYIPKYVTKKFIKDPQYVSSIKFVTGALIVPLFYFLISIILAIAFGLNFFGVLISIGIIGYISFMYTKLYQQFLSWCIRPILQWKLLKELHMQHLKIISILDPLFK